ncbi:MAG: rhodanese-like protein [Fusobacteria bacterium]|nr:MAG: rhodanese-like protein [Fusobacteriota bacterium]KAF0229749.1 MAG: rhodanese-like [Fusobacteriota bacterium]
MAKYLIGALIGGGLGYFVIYRIIGCSTGSCSITANPYLATLFGVIFGVLLTGIIVPTTNPVGPVDNNGTVIEYRKITPQEAKVRMDSGDELIIVDVRTEAEFKSGHIANAILIPNESIGKTRPVLLPDLDAEILVYCRSGNRSAQAAKKLIALGYTKVYDFGGITSWPYEVVK